MFKRILLSLALAAGCTAPADPDDLAPRNGVPMLQAFIGFHHWVKIVIKCATVGDFEPEVTVTYQELLPDESDPQFARIEFAGLMPAETAACFEAYLTAAGGEVIEGTSGGESTT